jgi:CelD/BcsL family acetyltransferase involved in cellulose biosynthesis
VAGASDPNARVFGSSRLVQISLDDPAWSNVVDRDSDALPFHHPAWAQLLAESYDFSAFALALEKDGGGFVGGVPVVEVRGLLGGRRWISLPFTDYCAPLVGRDTGLAARLEAEIDSARRDAGVDSLEVRGSSASDRAVDLPSGLRHTLPLDADPEITFGRLRPSVRNKIRSAGKQQLTVARAAHEDDLTRTFYGLHTATRRRLGVPVQPRRYFALLWRRFLEAGLGFVLVARASAKPIAAGVFLAWNSTIIYKYGASDAAYWRLRPNNAILWHAISWGCENGYSTFDFGRTESGNHGLREFKRGWGTEEAWLTFRPLAPSVLRV